MLPHTIQFYVHAVFMGVSWVFLLPLAIIVSRFGKHWHHPLWFKFHRAATAGAVALVVTAWILGMTIMSTRESKAHLWVGTLAVFFAAVQPAVAWFRPSMVHGDTPSPDRADWYAIHAWVGRLAVALGVTNVAIGFTLRGITGLWIVLVALPPSLLALAYCVFEHAGLHKNRPMKTTRRTQANETTPPSDTQLLLGDAAVVPRMRAESMRLDVLYVDAANRPVRRATEILQ